MKIGIAGPFNPACVKEYFDENAELPNINKTASSVNTYVRALLKLGHDVVVFTSNPFSDSTAVFEGEHIKIICITCKFFIRGFGRYRMHKRIRKYVAREADRLDILHAQWTYEYALAMLPFAKKRPVFCSVRDWCPYLLSIVKGKKNRYYWRMSYVMFKRVMAETSVRFIANSRYTEDRIRDAYPQDSVVVIPNPIDSAFITDHRETYPADPVIVSISNSLTNVRKNYKPLLLAFHEYRKTRPEAKLILIGSYTEEWKAGLQAESLLDNVELTGLLDHDAIFSVLDSASCLMHPALEETFGNILLEAMCRRLPCIGGENSGAVPQVLGEGAYGLLCDVTDPDSIRRALAETEDVEKMRKIIDDSTLYIKENYADTIVAKMHIDLYEKALSSKESAL